MSLDISQTKRFLDSNGNPIEELYVDRGRYDVIGIKRQADQLIVRATEPNGNETTLQFNFVEQPIKPIVPTDERRRDIDDDLLDVLLLSGYAVTDYTDTREVIASHV